LRVKRKITGVYLTREVVEALLTAAKEAHPREFLLLLRGKVKGDKLFVEELVVPPLATYGLGFASFNPYLLPLDPSIIGVAHSHPSGLAKPSLEDLDHFMGYVVVIVAYPYASPSDIHAYLANGIEVGFEVL